MKKVLVIGLALIVSAAVFAGGKKDAAPAGGGAASSGAASNAGKIVLLIRNQDEDFLRLYSNNVQALARAKGIELNIQDARSDAANQLTQLQTVLNQGYKYFVIIPQESGMSEQFNQLIQAQGGAAAYSNIQPTVPALKVGKNFFDASSPEFVGGSYQAALIADYFDKNPAKAPGKAANIVLINGQLGHPAQVNRKAGLIAGLKDRGYTANIVLEDTANWAPDQAQQKMDAWISSSWGKFNVVAAQNDGMALGAVESLITAGKTKTDSADGTTLQVPVLGIDATPAALASMKENKLYATVLQDAVGQSNSAFDVVYQVATGTYTAGNAAGGTPAAKTPIDEAPANDAAIIGQCYLVPFVPVDKASDYYKQNAK
jgi:ABC-type sugar transport system substrate-binding protein